MKITTNKLNLVAGLNKLTKVIGVKHIAVLDYVKIVAENGKVELIGSNIDLIGIVTLDSVEIEENGQSLLYFKNLLAFLKKSKSDLITIEDDNKNTTVISNKVNYRVNSVDVSEYPKLPVLKFEDVTLTNEEFKKAINNTGYSISTSESRPILQAINILIDSYGMKFVSTDSHRLGQFELNKDTNIEELQATPKGEGLKLAMKLLDKKNKEVKLKFSNLYTVVQFDNMELYVKNVEGNYPDTTRLIPSSFNTELELNTKELTDLIPQLSVFSKEDKNNVVTLNFEDNKVNISNVALEVGHISSDIEVKNISGEQVKINFSSKFFEDVLKTMDSKTIKLKFVGAMRPFIIEGLGQGEKHLVMPVRSYL